MSRGMESGQKRGRLVAVAPANSNSTPTKAPMAVRGRRSRRAAARAGAVLATHWPGATVPMPEPSTAHMPTDGALALLEEPQTFGAPRALLGQRRILIVEDDPRVAHVIRESLELEGETNWAVRIASAGVHALQIADGAIPDVVLLDVRLPDLDGAEVYRRLRANQGTRRPHVLFLSAGTSLDLYQRGIEDGVLLRKPFDVPYLVAIVRALLAN